MREGSLSYRAIAHRVGRNVATVLRCCRALFEDQCYFHRFIFVVAQLLSKYAISSCCIFHDK
jgi:DNA-binding MurR/RpiR family transcriptional regulator